MQKFEYGDLVSSRLLKGLFKVGFYDDNPANEGFVWIGGYGQKSMLVHQDILDLEN